ncbi:hypothetical protein KOPIIPEJ_03044 [Aeromonas dhakensis]
MTPLDILLSLTPEQGAELAASVAALWGTAWVVRVVTKILK